MSNVEDRPRYNWDDIYILLCCAEKLAFHPKLKNLTAAINAELEAIANPPVEEEEETEQSEEQTGDPGSPPDPFDPNEPKEKNHERRA